MICDRRTFKIERLLAGVAASVLFAGGALAQQEPSPKPTTPPAKDPAEPKTQPAPPASPGAQPKPTPAAEPPEGDDIPNLDDLLGTGRKDGATSAGNASKADLNRRLSVAELGDEFRQAVTLMGDAAKRINASKDTGATTQRVQQDVIRKLERLADQLQQQQSSSSQQQQQQQQNQDNQNSSRRQQQRNAQNQESQGENNAELEPPARKDGPLGPQIDGAAAWGSLPERARKMLLQGSGDRFSDAYRKLTEAYYRKLAEEGKK